MWSARQSRKMGRRVAGLLGGLLATILLVAAPAAAFVVPINVSNPNQDQDPPVPSELPAIAVNKAGRVFVAWKEGSGSNFRILFRRSNPPQGTCGGDLKFDEMPVSLWAGTVAPSRPALAANDTEVFVAWQASSAVWFNGSTNDGQAFFDPVPPSPVNLGSSRNALNVPSVAADTAGRVFVAWSNGSFPAEIFLTRYPSSGGGFEPAQPVSGTPLDSRAPSLATDGSNVFLAWEDGNFNPFDPFTPSVSVLYKKFGRSDVLTGVAGLVPANLSTGLGRAFGPNVAFGEGGLSVVFGTSTPPPPTGNGASFYHRLSGDGITFSAPQNVSGTMQSLSPSDARAARRNGSAMVAWAQRLGLTDADTEIQYWLGGATAEQGSVSPTPGAKSVNPAAAMDSTGRLLVAWQQSVNGDDEIYLSYQGGTGGGSLINALVEMTPQTLNAKTITQGEGVFTLRIRPLDGNAAEIDPGSLKFNDNDRVVSVLRWSLVDTDGIGGPDTLELKIRRSELSSAFSAATLTATQGDTDYRLKVNGNMTGGRCFTAEKKDVRIIH